MHASISSLPPSSATFHLFFSLTSLYTKSLFFSSLYIQGKTIWIADTKENRGKRWMWEVMAVVENKVCLCVDPEEEGGGG